VLKIPTLYLPVLVIIFSDPTPVQRAVRRPHSRSPTLALVGVPGRTLSRFRASLGAWSL